MKGLSIKLKVPLDKGLKAQVAPDSSGKLKGVHKEGGLWFNGSFKLAAAPAE